MLWEPADYYRPDVSLSGGASMLVAVAIPLVGLLLAYWPLRRARAARRRAAEAVPSSSLRDGPVVLRGVLEAEGSGPVAGREMAAGSGGSAEGPRARPLRPFDLVLGSGDRVHVGESALVTQNPPIAPSDLLFFPGDVVFARGALMEARSRTESQGYREQARAYALTSTPASPLMLSVRPLAAPFRVEAARAWRWVIALVVFAVWVSWRTTEDFWVLTFFGRVFEAEVTSTDLLVNGRNEETHTVAASALVGGRQIDLMEEAVSKHVSDDWKSAKARSTTATVPLIIDVSAVQSYPAHQLVLGPARGVAMSGGFHLAHELSTGPSLPTDALPFPVGAYAVATFLYSLSSRRQLLQRKKRD